MKKIFLLLLCVAHSAHALRSLPDASKRFQDNLNAYIKKTQAGTVTAVDALAVIDEYNSPENNDPAGKYKRVFDSILTAKKVTLASIENLARTAAMAPSAAVMPTKSPTMAAPTAPVTPVAPSAAPMTPPTGAPTLAVPAAIPPAPPAPPMPGTVVGAGKTKPANPVMTPPAAATPPVVSPSTPTTPAMPAAIPTAPPAPPMPGRVAGTASGKTNPTSPMMTTGQNLGLASPTKTASINDDEMASGYLTDAELDAQADKLGRRNERNANPTIQKAKGLVQQTGGRVSLKNTSAAGVKLAEATLVELAALPQNDARDNAQRDLAAALAKEKAVPTVRRTNAGGQEGPLFSSDNEGAELAYGQNIFARDPRPLREKLAELVPASVTQKTEAAAAKAKQLYAQASQASQDARAAASKYIGQAATLSPETQQAATKYVNAVKQAGKTVHEAAQAGVEKAKALGGQAKDATFATLTAAQEKGSDIVAKAAELTPSKVLGIDMSGAISDAERNYQVAEKAFLAREAEARRLEAEAARALTEYLSEKSALEKAVIDAEQARLAAAEQARLKAPRTTEEVTETKRMIIEDPTRHNRFTAEEEAEMERAFPAFAQAEQEPELFAHDFDRYYQDNFEGINEEHRIS